MSSGTRPLAPQQPAKTAPLPERAAEAVGQPAHGHVAAALRDIGQVRDINQDSVFALSATLPREGRDLPFGIYVVADGMGGHDGGEIASKMAVGEVVRTLLAGMLVPALLDGTIEPIQVLLDTAISDANRAIWNHARSIGSDMGTTCTAALLLGHTLYLGHVGDSRAYLLSATGLTCLTPDHSAVGRLIELGQITPEQARDHAARSQLYRTVGQAPEVAVDVIRAPFGAASHLLLCSDGLWGMLDEATIRTAMQAPWPHLACQQLIDAANAAGGEDNISAVVVALPQQVRP